MEILSQEQEQNQVQEPIAEQYAEMERSQDNFYRSQMLKHLTGKPVDYPISYWRMRFGGFKSVAPPQNVRMDIFGIKNPAKKGARVIHRSWSIAWRTRNEERLSRALGG